MTVDPASPVVDKIDGAASPRQAADRAQRAVGEMLSTLEKSLTELAKVAERAIRQGAAGVRNRTGASARETVDEAQQFLVDRIMERPVTAALAGVGLGLLLGVLLSGRGK